MTAEEFKARRKKLFPTQALAARALGVTQGAVAHWEMGIRAIPGPIKLLLDSLEKNPEAVNAIVNKSRTIRGTKKGGRIMCQYGLY